MSRKQLADLDRLRTSKSKPRSWREWPSGQRCLRQILISASWSSST